MASFLPPIGRSSQPYGQLPLPPGSALRFSADDLSADEQRLSNSNALMQNLETEMGRLLEWAGAGGGEAAGTRSAPRTGPRCGLLLWRGGGAPDSSDCVSHTQAPLLAAGPC